MAAGLKAEFGVNDIRRKDISEEAFALIQTEILRSSWIMKIFGISVAEMIYSLDVDK